jgi:hypothetical protein
MRLKTAHKILINEELTKTLAEKQGRPTKAIISEARHTIISAKKRNKRKLKHLTPTIEEIDTMRLMGESEL